MMRILHVYRTYFPDTQGGLEEVIRQICRNTISCDVESRIFTLSGKPVPAVINSEEAEIHRFARTFEISSCSVSIKGVYGFRGLVDWADVVHYHFPWPFADFLHLLGRVKKPSLVTYHSDIVRQKHLLKFYWPVMRRFLDNVDKIVATSQNYFATSETLGEFSEKVEVIPIGLDDSSYPVVDEAKLHSMRGRVGEGFFLFVGVLRYYKGLHILLDAVNNTNLNVVIVGSGPVEKELKQHALQLGLKNVRFLGCVNNADKVALIRLAKAIVFPSYLRSEAFGVTLIEGAMYSKPLISVEIGTGTSFVNKDGITGFVVPPTDSKSLREAMEKLESDPGLAEKMGRAARERYECLFTGRLMGERYANLYKQLVRGVRR